MNYQIQFSEIFAEGRDEKVKPLLNRDVEFDIVDGKATVFTGVRRAGKSTFLKQIITQKKNLGVILHVNFVDERLVGLTAAQLSQMFDGFYQVYPESAHNQKMVLMLDEIQVVDQWESFVERQLRQTDRIVFITGSSAKLLGDEIATAMRGRSLRYEIFPFSLDEYLKWVKKSELNLTSLKREEKSRVAQWVLEYLTNGGFPEATLVSAATRNRILQEYFETILFRDVIERHNVAAPILAKRLLHQLISQFASTVSINKLVERLKAEGIGTTKQYVSQLVDWFQDAYAVFLVPIYSESIHRQNTNPKKCYVIDNGLVNAIIANSRGNFGRLLENAVFLALRRQNKDVFYYKTKDGFEVDFYLEQKHLIQVCWSLDDEDTRKRELRALEDSMSELGHNRGVIVTHREEEEIKIGRKVIKVIPSWKFLGAVGLSGLFD